MIAKKYGEKMKNIIVGLLISLVFLGCGDKKSDENVEPKLVVGQTVSLSLNDQNEKAHSLSPETKTLIFAFSKDMGHTCNDFFAKKDENYLTEHNTVFVADVSSAPSVIRSMFILPGMKDFKHTILVMDDEAVASAYKAGMNLEQIVVVSLDKGVITEISNVTTVDDLAKKIEIN